MDDQIDIKGLAKARLLQELYEAAVPKATGFVPAARSRPVGAPDVRVLQESDFAGFIEQQGQPLAFEYLAGHILRCDISGDQLDPRHYDKANGPGTAAKVVEQLRGAIAAETPAVEPVAPTPGVREAAPVLGGSKEFKPIQVGVTPDASFLSYPAPNDEVPEDDPVAGVPTTEPEPGKHKHGKHKHGKHHQEPRGNVQDPVPAEPPVSEGSGMSPGPRDPDEIDRDLGGHDPEPDRAD